MNCLFRVFACLFLFVSLKSFSSIEFYTDRNTFLEKYGAFISVEENFNDLANGSFQNILFDGFSIISSDGSGLFVDQPSFSGASSKTCLLYTSPSPRDRTRSRMPSSA